MNWTTGVSILALLVAAVGLLRSILDGGKTSAAAMAQLTGRVDTLEARTNTMDGDLKEVKTAVANLPVMNAKLDGLDRLVSARMDAQDKTLGRIEDSLARATSH